MNFILIRSHTWHTGNLSQMDNADFQFPSKTAENKITVEIDYRCSKGKGKGVGFKSWSQAGSHNFTILPRWLLEKARPQSYILSFTGSEFSAPQGLHFLSDSSPLTLGRRCLMWIPISKVRHNLWKLAERRDLNPGPIDLESPFLPLGKIIQKTNVELIVVLLSLLADLIKFGQASFHIIFANS